ncbi:THO complex subunit 2-like protein [Corchorus olitorius]|uniref:THO complex subunit 2-like protein n=1 Tax=Corchorus olitorius TaxID=93759 RepID=A0A1R3J4Z4_9ROSI|nr:THO complex subunit 2-like protein [Corchorus olitorius]
MGFSDMGSIPAILLSHSAWKSRIEPNPRLSSPSPISKMNRWMVKICCCTCGGELAANAVSSLFPVVDVLDPVIFQQRIWHQGERVTLSRNKCLVIEFKACELLKHGKMKTLGKNKWD